MTVPLKPPAKKEESLKQLPGPSPFQAVKNTVAFQRDPIAFLTQMAQDYGDLCQFQLLIGPLVFLNHPDYVRSMIIEHQRSVDKKTPFFGAVKVMGRNGLASAEETLWQKQRRLIQPAFHKQHLNSFAQIMTDTILTCLRRWDTIADRGDPIDITKELAHLTTTVVSKTIFNDLEFGDQSNDLQASISESFHFLGQYFRMPFPPLFLPTKRNREFKNTLQHLDEIVSAFIKKRRSKATPGSDLLGVLLAARDEVSGEGMSNEQLRDEVVTLFTGAIESIPSTLSFALYLLSQHPEVQERLDEEVDRVLAGRMPTNSDLPQLIYTRMIIDETLRWYPTGWMLMRRCLEEQELAGYRIPRHSLLVYSAYLLHRNPAFWEEPQRFMPERFTREQQKRRHPQVYFPFGAGSHLCIGQPFALMEITLALAILTSRYRLALVPGQSVETAFGISLSLRNGLQMYVCTREKGVN